MSLLQFSSGRWRRTEAASCRCSRWRAFCRCRSASAASRKSTRPLRATSSLYASPHSFSCVWSARLTRDGTGAERVAPQRTTQLRRLLRGAHEVQGHPARPLCPTNHRPPEYHTGTIFALLLDHSFGNLWYRFFCNNLTAGRLGGLSGKEIRPQTPLFARRRLGPERHLVPRGPA
jgi:hypothetical protein